MVLVHDASVPVSHTHDGIGRGVDALGREHGERRRLFEGAHAAGQAAERHRAPWRGHLVGPDGGPLGNLLDRGRADLHHQLGEHDVDGVRERVVDALRTAALAFEVADVPLLALAVECHR